MAKRVRSLGSFRAHSNDGREFIIDATQEFIENTDLDGVVHFSAGMKRLETRNGDAVNRMAFGRYQIVHLRLNVHSDDPNAL